MLIKQHSLTKEDFIDFTTLLLAFLISKDPISLWFREYVELATIDLDKILESKKLNTRILFEKIQNKEIYTNPFEQKPKLTVFANSIFTEATTLNAIIAKENNYSSATEKCTLSARGRC